MPALLPSPALAATALLLCLTMASMPGHASQRPEFGAFAYRQQPGALLPLGTPVRDQAGREARLGDLLQGRPAILALVYHRCPNLCGIVRADLFQALGRTGLIAGRDYTLLAFSIDPAETPSDAAAACARDMAAFPLPGAGQSWHYLTADANGIRAVADAVGFRSRFDPDQKQFLHPAGVVIATRAGVLSTALLGVGYRPAELRSAVLRAGQGAVASAVSLILLLCFHFDPTTGGYDFAVGRALSTLAVLTILTLAGLFAALQRRPGGRA